MSRSWSNSSTNGKRPSQGEKEKTLVAKWFWFACLELEGGEGVGGAGEQDGGVELLLEAVAEAAPGLRDRKSVV